MAKGKGKGRELTEFIGFRCTPVERERLKDLCRLARITEAEMLRRLIDGAQVSHSPSVTSWIVAETPAEYSA